MNAERRSYRRFPYAVAACWAFQQAALFFFEKLKIMIDYKFNL